MEDVIPEKIPNPIDRIPPEKRPKKGEVRNPKGKPKGLVSLKTLIEKYGRVPIPEAYAEKIKAAFPNLKKISLHEAMILRALLDAATGDDKAREYVSERTEGKALQTIKNENPPEIHVHVIDEATKANMEALKTLG